MSACIIPVAPDFQDPPAAPNYPPYIESATPDFGSIVTPPSLLFSVTVTDPNLGDDLLVRWLADYPGVNYRTLGPDQPVSHSVDGLPLHKTVSATVDCLLDNLAMTADGEHRVEVIVTDGKFKEPTDSHLDLVDPPNFVVRAGWILEQLSCPSSPPQ